MSPRFVYVLQSETDPDRFYTGRTTNVADRLAAHNGGFSRHTADGRPWRVIVAIEFADPQKASDFEKYLKSGSGRAFALRHFR
jgi:putative endonuclease